VATPGHTKASRVYFDGYRVSQAISAANVDFATDAAEATAIEDSAKVFYQGKTGMTSALNGFVDVTDDGWDELEFATINDGAHEITVCPVGTTGSSIAYVAQHFSTGDSRAYDQANVVMLNWNGQNEDQEDFGRGTVLTTSEWTATEASSDAGDEVGAAARHDDHQHPLHGVLRIHGRGRADRRVERRRIGRRIRTGDRLDDHDERERLGGHR